MFRFRNLSSQKQKTIKMAKAASIADHVFKIKWTNRDETIADGIQQMFAKREQLNLIIKLAEGKQLKAHRHIMAIASPTIAVKLEGQVATGSTMLAGKCFVHILSEPSQLNS